MRNKSEYDLRGKSSIFDGGSYLLFVFKKFPEVNMAKMQIPLLVIFLESISELFLHRSQICFATIGVCVFRALTTVGAFLYTEVLILKRISSVLLTIAMLLTFIPTVSYAAMGDYGGNITGATWYWPFRGYSSTSSAYSKITSSYGYRGGSFNRMHYGVDIGMSSGTATYPTRSGTITKVDNDTSGPEGRCIIINHGDGYFSSYHHLSKIAVSKGQYVSVDTQIGAVGGSGYGSESYYGAHLHMQIHYGSSLPTNFETNVNPCPSGYTREGGAMQADVGGYPVGTASISYSIKTYTEAPSKSIISTEKTEYAVDEIVNFKFDTDGTKGCNVLWIYCPDGSTLYYTDLYDTYSLGFGMSGNFEALVQTWNDVGSKSSEKIKFHIGTPTYASISLSKNEFAINETITFTLTTDSTPNCNSVWIYYPDGSSKSYTDIGNSFSVKIDTPGNYEALVQAWNSIGAKSSERINFHIGSPTYANIQLPKNEFYVNEPISFYLDTDATPNCNCVWIYCPDGTTLSYTDLDTSLDIKLDKPGNYEAVVQAWNSLGSKQSNRIKFIVTDPDPRTESTVTKSGANLIIDIKVYNITAPYDILIVGYKNNKFVTMKRVPHDEQNFPYTLEGDIDEIKVMVWNGLSTLKPLCDAEEIPSSKWITE